MTETNDHPSTSVRAPGMLKRPSLATEHLANERTFLAWIRTSLAMTGCGNHKVRQRVQLPENVMRFAALLLSSALTVFSAGCATTATPGRDRDGTMPDATLTILHTNDVHGQITPWVGWEGDLSGKSVGGFDRVASVAKSVRAEVGEGNVLLLDAGDAIGDTMIAAETKGRAIFQVMERATRRKRLAV